jgi:hypothetical protein
VEIDTRTSCNDDEFLRRRIRALTAKLKSLV